MGDERLLQITIAIQVGNSGGPVVTDSGFVVGVVVSKLDDLAMLKDTGTLPENVNFAIKASQLTSVLRGVKLLSGTKRTGTRAEAVSRAQAAACQVIAFTDSEPTGTGEP